MGEDDTWIGQCEWCGESDVTLISDNDLPDWTEGVACLSCHKSIMEEKEKQDEIEYERNLGNGWGDGW